MNRLHRRGFRPLLEVFEDRLCPSTLTVMNNSDHNAGSLRSAITAASSGDTIKFANSVHNIVLTTGELDLTKNLSIVGPGANKLSISGNDASRIFDIATGTTVTLSGMTI